MNMLVSTAFVPDQAMLMIQMLMAGGIPYAGKERSDIHDVIVIKKAAESNTATIGEDTSTESGENSETGADTDTDESSSAASYSVIGAVIGLIGIVALLA
jgi:hypothetical protein